MQNIQQHIIHQVQREIIVEERFSDVRQEIQDECVFEMHLI